MSSTNATFDETLNADLSSIERVIEVPDSIPVKLFNCVYNALLHIHSAGGDRGQTRKELSSDNPESFCNMSLPAKAKWRIGVLRDSLLSRNAKNYLKRNPLVVDAVITSYSPAWPHSVAREMRASGATKVWLADFRDPIFIGNHFLVDGKRKEAIMRVVDSADCVSCINEDVLDKLSIRESQRRAIITNGFDPQPRARTASATFDIVYTGTLYDGFESKSDLTPLAQAIQELVQKKLIKESLIRFVYAGRQGDIFNRQMRAFGCDRVAANYGFVGRSEALALQDSASILVLCVWNTPHEQGVVTGKVFEYISAQVPVIALCSGSVGNSAMKELMKKTDAGICYEEATKDQDYLILRDYILNKYLEWKESNMTISHSNKQVIDTFSYKNISLTVIETLDALLETPQDKEQRNAE